MVGNGSDQPGLRRGAEAAAVALAVAATTLAYPPLRVPGLGLVMLAPVAFLLDRARPRRAFVLVWLYSAVFALCLVPWLVHALAVEYRVPATAAWLFTVLLVAALAVVPGAAGAGYAAIAPRLTAAAAPLAFAAAWTLGEWLRGAGLGVPWLLAAHTLSRWLPALQAAEWVGQYGVSFAVIGVSAGLGIALRRRDARALLAPAAVAALWLGTGALKLTTYEAPAGRRARIGVVQASVPQAERFQPGSAVRNVARHAQATRALAAREALDLVVWSETAVDIDLDQTPELRASLERLAAEIGVPVVTGAPRSAGGRRTNAVALFAPDGGLVESYDKQRLVPFSEYDPPFVGFLAPLIGPVVEGDPYVPGAAPTVFRAGPIPLATPVCFEITYPDLARRFRVAGAQLLVNLSNDAWFGRVGYPEMHFDHAIWRAVEARVAVVRGANTGISGAIAPTGRVLGTIAPFTEGTLEVEVAAAGGPTLYVLAGDAPLVAALVVLVGAAAGRRRPRRSQIDVRRGDAPARPPGARDVAGSGTASRSAGTRRRA